MVGLDERGPPVADDPIADKLIQGVIPLENHLRHCPKVLVELSYPLLGRMLLGKARESEQVRGGGHSTQRVPWGNDGGGLSDLLLGRMLLGKARESEQVREAFAR